LIFILLACLITIECVRDHSKIISYDGNKYKYTLKCDLCDGKITNTILN
jgi:hypothetical protein